MRIRGAFRIRKLIQVEGYVEDAGTFAEEQKTADDYIQRLLKLIPSEIVGIYLIGRQTAIEQNANPWWALICLVLVIFFRAWTTAPDVQNQPIYKGIQWLAVFASTLSFIIWVHAMGDVVLGLSFFKEWMASLATLVWGVVAPTIITGDPVEEG